MHGTAVSGQDDRDEMGLCLEPPEFVTGLARVPEPERAYLRSVRRGEVPLAEVLAAVGDAEQRLAALQESPAVPPEPDTAWVDGWLHRSHLAYWAGLR